MLQVKESRGVSGIQILLAVLLLGGCSEPLSLKQPSLGADGVAEALPLELAAPADEVKNLTPQSSTPQSSAPQSSTPQSSTPQLMLTPAASSPQLARAATNTVADPFGIASQSTSADRTSPTRPLVQFGSKPTSKTVPAQSGLQGEHQGRFRVGNQTEHPLRVAFLQQPETGQASPKSAEIAEDPTSSSSANSADAANMEPIHWDFAPGEGGQSGLVLSVPQGDVELRPGDVLVAFAQDGSRRYWGPYVVGQTQLPFWNSERSEWQLLIQP